MNLFPSRSFFVRFGTLVAACLRGCSYISRQSPFGHLPSLEVVGTARSPSSVRRLIAVFSARQDRGFDPLGSRQLPIKERERPIFGITQANGKRFQF